MVIKNCGCVKEVSFSYIFILFRKQTKIHHVKMFVSMFYISAHYMYNADCIIFSDFLLFILSNINVLNRYFFINDIFLIQL